jgi:flagellar biosynthesis/type III secretory pathway protein FliH
LEQEEKNAGKKWMELESKSYRDYQEIIQSANKKAEEIILQATELKEDTGSNFQNSVNMLLEEQEKLLKDASSALSKKFQEQAEEVNHNNVEMLSNIYKDIEKNAEESYSEYKELIKKQTFEAERIAQEKIRGEYSKLEQEVKEYREKMMQKVNDDIFKILLNVSKTVIGKSLSFKDQQDLIINSLAQAKKENLI